MQRTLIRNFTRRYCWVLIVIVMSISAQAQTPERVGVETVVQLHATSGSRSSHRRQPSSNRDREKEPDINRRSVSPPSFGRAHCCQ